MKIIKISFLLALILLTLILMLLGLQEVSNLINHVHIACGILIPIIGGVTIVIINKLINQLIKQFKNKTNEKTN